MQLSMFMDMQMCTKVFVMFYIIKQNLYLVSVLWCSVRFHFKK